jgi:hypothetical protein
MTHRRTVAGGSAPERHQQTKFRRPGSRPPSASQTTKFPRHRRFLSACLPAAPGPRRGEFPNVLSDSDTGKSWSGSVLFARSLRSAQAQADTDARRLNTTNACLSALDANTIGQCLRPAVGPLIDQLCALADQHSRTSIPRISIPRSAFLESGIPRFRHSPISIPGTSPDQHSPIRHAPISIPRSGMPRSASPDQHSPIRHAPISIP